MLSYKSCEVLLCICSMIPDQLLQCGNILPLQIRFEGGGGGGGQLSGFMSAVAAIASAAGANVGGGGKMGRAGAADVVVGGGGGEGLKVKNHEKLNQVFFVNCMTLP